MNRPMRRLLVFCLILSNVAMFFFYAMFLRDLIRQFLFIYLSITANAMHLAGTVWDPWAAVCVLPAYHTWALTGIYMTPVRDCGLYRQSN